MDQWIPGMALKLPVWECAQMGPSGSGKTTLLDVLAGRKTSGRIEGSVLFAGVQPSSMFLRRYTGYVEQFGTGAVCPCG